MTDELIHHSIWGHITRQEMIERLEAIRKSQEAAWYAAGYSRDQIAHMLKGWPHDFGPAYEWSVGEQR